MPYKRISRYYPGDDGTKLAVDLYLPETTEKVPVLVQAGYEKRRQRFERDRETMEYFLNENYAMAIIEVRGSGASYGISDGFFGLHDGKDIGGIIDALSKEDWCNGNAAMFGGSNYGMSQEITAVQQPEALKAVVPCDCSMDFYDQDFPNGVSALPEGMAPHDSPAEELQCPVDDDIDGSQMKEAVACHARNLPFLAQHVKNMYRDDVNPKVGYRPNLAVPAWESMDKVRFGHTFVSSIGSWFDPGCTNKILTYKYWGGKLLLGPWPHCGIYTGNNFGLPNAAYDWRQEHRRLFDEKLKGKDANVSEEPPVRYYTIGDDGREWKYEEDFPVSGTRFAALHLNADNTLTEAEAAAGSLSYTVRKDIMIYGRGMRMNRNVDKAMNGEDLKSLTFTSEPLPEDMEITGVPSLDLYVTSSHTDGNFIAVLEEVTRDGVSHFLTEGMIRASHAKTHRNPVYEAMGLPYHRGFREDKVELPSHETNRPLKLSFHLEVLSRILHKGSRIRLAVSCGGSGFQMPEGFPDEMPEIRLYTGKAADSALTLPVIKGRPDKYVFEEGFEAYLYKTAVYLKENGRFTRFPVSQIYPVGKIGEEHYIYEATADISTANAAAGVNVSAGGPAEDTAPGTDVIQSAKAADAAVLRAEVVYHENKAVLALTKDGATFRTEAAFPARYVPENASPEIPVSKAPWAVFPEVSVKNLYVATVPVAKGAPGNMNPMMRKSFDLFIDLIYPEEKTDRMPVIVNIHGFGGSHHQFEDNTDDFLKLGYAVASLDYRLTPPCTYEAPVHDAKGCIRYLKAHADELGLDKDRIGIIGGSMGGYLTGMIAATNGSPETEGCVGGNTDETSSVKASVTAYGPMDLLHFGDDANEIWPGQQDKIANGDGPFAPPASMIGYVGPGKGVADLKKHLFDSDPEYVRLLALLKDASPISHVTENSAPICLVHGIFDCGIQVPLGQSMRLFDAYTRKGVKALALLNNNGLYGQDPEVRDAVVRFLKDRV